MENLRERYIRLKDTPSDINEHMTRLYLAGKMYHHITEFGVRYGTSTTAFLMGQSEAYLEATYEVPTPTLISYDVNRHQDVELLLAIDNTGVFDFRLENTLTAVIEPTLCLFIDTYHVGLQLQQELDNCHSKVLREIILHDVVTFGAIGENGQAPGLQWAMTKFLSDHPEWQMVEWAPNNNGLAVLGRSEESQAELLNSEDFQNFRLPSK